MSNNQEEYELPLKIIQPEITTNMLGEEAFPDVLGSFSTRYDASNKNRAKNIELAAEAINGTVLMPGEKFSFNGIVGNTTSAKGYMLARCIFSRRTCRKLRRWGLSSFKYDI